MTPTPAIGAVLGLLFGFGLVLAISRVPVMRRPRLDARLVPYLVDRRDASRRVGLSERTITPFPTLERIVRPQLNRCGDVLERFLGGTVSVRKRLEQAGTDLSVAEFRVEQVIWGVVGFGAAVLVSVILVAQGIAQSPIAMFVFSVTAGVAGVFGRDRALSRQVRDREARILAEFPTIADLLALSVSAGEGPVGALERVARTSRGELARELNRALMEARTGATLVQALEGIAGRTSLAPLARFADGMSVAIERGTPLADVLRAQAADVREAGKRALLEAGGRREIAMMVPVVFLVMPITILFALFPGFIALSQTVP
jgi:tight adherence protein C